jgi:hypothetical protein
MILALLISLMVSLTLVSSQSALHALAVACLAFLTCFKKGSVASRIT